MSISITSRQAGSYQVTIPVYEGPLDLLLQLIEQFELDITKVSLAKVTDQYLEHLGKMQERSAEEVSAFIVIAARLLQIKSEVLLPRPPVREPGEEDPGEALARQLLAYKRYREIAEFLAQREEQGLRTYLRLAPPPKVEGILDLSGIGLGDLITAAQSLLGFADNRPALATVVAPPRFTIRDKIRQIVGKLRSGGQFGFHSILGTTENRLEIIVTFLAILELIKLQLIHARQEEIFGEIELQADANINENDEFDLEFGE